MQPLYSVDHESRNNSTNHIEEERQAPVVTESSPLLQRFPQYTHPRNSSTGIIVTFLLIILITGIIIGIYLLVIQSESEHVLPPPVERPLQLVTRSQWDYRNISQSIHKLPPLKTNEVMLVQTNTSTCQSTESCTKLLREMQKNSTAGLLPYNFLISSNGQTYEGLGWHSSSLASQPTYNGLVLALIGNFSQVSPTPLQILEAKKFFAMSLSQQHLNQNFSIVGKNVHDTPKYLLKSLDEFPQWSHRFVEGIN